MSHSRVSYITWLIHTCHVSFICAMTHSYVWRFIHTCHDSFICYECVTAHANESWMRHCTHERVMARPNESWHARMSHGTYQWVMAHMNHGTGWVMSPYPQQRHVAECAYLSYWECTALSISNTFVYTMTHKYIFHKYIFHMTYESAPHSRYQTHSYIYPVYIQHLILNRSTLENALIHIWMSLGTYNESWNIWRGHVTLSSTETRWRMRSYVISRVRCLSASATSSPVIIYETRLIRIFYWSWKIYLWVIEYMNLCHIESAVPER